MGYGVVGFRGARIRQRGCRSKNQNYKVLKTHKDTEVGIGTKYTQLFRDITI